MRGGILAGLLVAATMAAGPARALDVVDAIVAELRSAGYAEIDVGRTLLGRTRIEASGGGAHREIILDPRTGEILRDYWEILDPSSAEPGQSGIIGGSKVASDDGDGSNSGKGSSGGDDSDDDHDGDRDDNSGHGGGDDDGGGDNSGSGGSGGSGHGGDDDDDD